MIKFLTLACFVAVALGGTIPGTSDKMQGFIVGGKATDIKEAPYTVGLLRNGRFFCGGSIVTPTVIVTAAHCVINQNWRSLSVRVGSSKSYTGGHVIPIRKFDIHPKYSPSLSDYDVAVLVLARPVEYSETVKPIPLASTVPRDRAFVKTVGYGRLREGGPLSENLQSVMVPVVETSVCSDNYALYDIEISDRMLCAGVGGKDSCQGDSGGPLVHENELAGVVSFGVGCARHNLPGVYAKVANSEISSFLKKYVKN